MNGESGIRKCKILYVKWINNKVLLITKGNYIQYSVTDHNGKKNENNVYINMCITGSLSFTA